MAVKIVWIDCERYNVNIYLSVVIIWSCYFTFSLRAFTQQDFEERRKKARENYEKQMANKEQGKHQDEWSCKLCLTQCFIMCISWVEVTADFSCYHIGQHKFLILLCENK